MESCCSYWNWPRFVVGGELIINSDRPTGCAFVAELNSFMRRATRVEQYEGDEKVQFMIYLVHVAVGGATGG